MELRKISNCDIDCPLNSREQLPSVRITLSEYPPCAGSEARDRSDRSVVFPCDALS